MDPAGAAGAGVAWPARGGPGDGRRDLSSPPPLEPPYKKVRNNAFPAYPSQEEMRGDSLGGFATHTPNDQSYGAPPFNHSPGLPGYGAQQQAQRSSNGYAPHTSHTSSYNPPPSGFPPGSAKGTGAFFLKTKLCTKFKLGTCTFDDRCHFAHGMEDLRKPPVGWETMVANAGQGGPVGGRSNDGLQQRKKSSKPCRFFADGKECPYGDRCTFVHASGDDAYPASGFGNSDSGGMPPSSGRFKTRMCARWERGEPCNYGERCHYAHGYAELQSSTGVSTYGNDNVAAVNTVQYPGEMAPYSTQFSNASTINAPPAAAPHGGPFTVANAPPAAAPHGGQFTVANAHAPPNTYPTAGTGAQEVINDYAKPQSYWNGVPPQAGYVQANQAAGGWAGNHNVEGGYSKDLSSAAQYIPAPIQQQPGVQPYASGSVGVYQEPKQIVNAPYVQDGSRVNYQTETMGGKGGYYPATY